MKNLPPKLFLILIPIFILAGQNVLAQETGLGIVAGKTTFKEFFEQVTIHSGYKFAVNRTRFDVDAPVTVPATGAKTMTELLDKVFNNTVYTYTIVGKQIVVTRKPEAPLPIVTHLVPSSFENDVEEFSGLLAELLHENIPPAAADCVSRPVIPQPAGNKHFEYPLGRVSLRESSGAVPVNNPYTINTPPRLSVKSNVLYSAVAQSLNISAESGIGKRTSAELAVGWNPWNREGKHRNNKKFVHWVLKPEFRYWLCERNNGHFFGAHLFYTRYNISGNAVPTVFKKDYRYKGYGFGGGLSYGYHLMLHRHWGVEFTIGIGLADLRFDKFECAKCGDMLGRFHDTYYGITGAGIKLVFMIK